MYGGNIMGASTTSGHSPSDVQGNPKLYRKLLFYGGAIVLVILAIAWMTWDRSLLGKYGIAFNGGPTAILFIIVYLTLSLKEVRADEIAGAFCYGKALLRLHSGLHFVPFGLMQIAKKTRTVQEFQCPGEPERVFKGDDKDKLPEGMVRSIRAVTRAPKDKEKGILDTQMTLSVNFVVQYAITDIFDYIANFGSKEEIEKQLRDVGEVKVVEDITQNTPAGFIKKLPVINAGLAGQVKGRFENSGIKIISVRLVSPDISHEVSAELANVPKARAKAAQAEITAGGEKTKRTKEGEGAAAAELALLTAQATGRKVMKEALGVTGETIMAGEAVRGLSDKTDVLVVGAESGMRDVMGLVKGAQSALSVGKGAQP